MKFEPKSEKDFQGLNLFPEGEYGFQVTNAADDVSKKSGRDMIVLDVLLFNNDGSNRKVRDWLVPGTIYGDKKIFEFAKSAGILALYESGTFGAQDCVDKTGFAKVAIEKGKPDPKGGTYPDKNVIRWYISKPVGVKAAPDVKTDMAAAKAMVAAVDDGTGEDVPF
jgi:hypothetical protein